ncbi:hypothetical protein FA15DRAFT_635179 [Coprinopsis marcescibilis]|uniref:Heat shock factor binding protein 1 n=1 Tax=Coprinopsis marcescibilis TaxID=230819 RepID=A0A5C3L6T4_COPMA|nr:hypothetical protein FA15DRAFT_635179 [Coprinopsis marcescibilis]
MSSALPLKVPATPGKSADSDKEKTPVITAKQPAKVGALAPKEISSPHELTAFVSVENILDQLDSKFEDMSSQILDRMNQMSSRVDALEASIQDIINTDVPMSPSPMPGTPLSVQRSDSGFNR